MGKEKFVYNTQTLRYDKVKEPLKAKLLRVFGFVCMAVFTAFIFTILSHRYFPSPKEKTLLNEIDAMKAQYESLLAEVNTMGKALDNIQERDAYAHRMILGMNPIDKGIWNGGIGGHDKYADLRANNYAGDMMADATERVEAMKRKIALQSKSLDTIVILAREKENMLASIPSIKPVRADKLNRDVSLLSGFGWRVHPIFKVRKMHTGIDFSAPQGTPIQATGDGKVLKVEYQGSGYGHCVTIDHGYGYQTLYGHMSRIDIRPGQAVKRGQQIGAVGSTGTSTAPHCHYEIILKGEKVNPIHYCMDGLSSEEYEELVKAAESVNQSFD